MTNQKELCNQCGAKLVNGECPDCPENNGCESVILGVQPTKKTKSKHTPVVVVVLLIVAFLGYKVVSDKMSVAKLEDTYFQEVDRYIEEVNKYVPGTLEGETYCSKFWNLKFQCNNDWIMYNEEERKIISENTKISVRESSINALNRENPGTEIKQKLENASYADTEMAACFYADSEMVGEVTFNVISVYNVNGITAEKCADEIKANSYQTCGETVRSEENLAGVKYQTLTFDIQDKSAGTVKAKMYIRKKDKFVMWITIKGINGHGTDVFESFANLTQKY